MQAIFKLLIEQLNSSVFILLFILIAIAFLLFHLGNFLGRWTEKIKNQDDKLSDVKTISDRVIKLETKVDLIYQNTNPKSLVHSKSPMTLTDKGKELFTKINAEKIFERHLPKLKEFIENENPQNAYDIQTTSMKIAASQMINLLNQDELIAIKDHAFKQGLLIEDIMQIFGVLLRDVVLADKGIAIHEVDAHDPNKN